MIQTLKQGIDAVISRNPGTGDATIVTIEGSTEAITYRLMAQEEARWNQCEFSRVYPTPKGFAVKGVCCGRVDGAECNHPCTMLTQDGTKLCEDCGEAI